MGVTAVIHALILDVPKHSVQGKEGQVSIIEVISVPATIAEGLICLGVVKSWRKVFFWKPDVKEI